MSGRGREVTAEQFAMFGEAPVQVIGSASGRGVRYGGAPLHRIHAAPAQGRGGASLDVAGLRWRGDGRMDNKAEVAFRLALCWNLCEGWPTVALEGGVLRRLSDARDRLVAAVLDTPGVPESLVQLARDIERVVVECADELDTTNGRIHDCEDCLSKLEGERDG